jgi:hypothetical protein
MNPTLQNMLDELRERVYLRIDRHVESAKLLNKAKAQAARRSVGQTFRWAGRAPK